MAKRRILAFVFTLLCLLTAVPAKAEGNKEDGSGHLLKQGEAAVANEQYTRAVRLFCEAREEAVRQKNQEDEIIATYDVGVCYLYVGANGDALHYFYDALQLCQRYGINKQGMIQNAIAGVYFDMQNYDKAWQLVEAVYNKAKQQNDSVNAALYASDMALICNKHRRFDLTEKYLNEAMKWQKKSPKSNLANVKMILAEAYFLQRQYNKVVALAPKVFADPLLQSSDKTLMHIYLLEIYTRQGKYAQAWQEAKAARSLALLRRLPDLFASMAELYRRQGNLAMALCYKDSVIAANDSVMKQTNRQLVESSQVKIETMKVKANMERERLQLSRNRLMSAASVVLCLMVMALALSVMRSQKIKNAAARRQLRAKLDQRNHELAAATLFLSSRNSLIADLLQGLSATSVADDLEIKSLTNHLKQLLRTSTEHDDFMVNFEKANPDFIRRLREKHPRLLASDVRFLSYIRMNLSNKDIASLLNINPESCKRRRIRISKKLGLDTSAHLFEYISSL
ncbi:MAG: hypothetical protein SPL43_00550 [Prevotella sp.]|nr:hypothetical protein [Prevotella sp.]